jgi:putative hydrolase of HD superfamily
MHNTNLPGILAFLHEAEGLKKELRHSWLSDGRRESVAEHTWRMALMAIVLQPEVNPALDLGHVLKMIIVHDLGEVYAGDYQVYGKPVPENKHELEAEALEKLLKLLPSHTKQEIFSLWLEFEERSSEAAIFAVALDKLEVIIQHNEADVSTYLEGEGEYNLTYADDNVKHNETLIVFRELIRAETKKKIGSN